MRRTGLAHSRGIGSSPQGSPRAPALGGTVDGTGTTSVEAVKALLVHHSLKCLRSVGQPKMCEQIFKQAKRRNDCSFWDVLSRNRDLVITLDKINF